MGRSLKLQEKALLIDSPLFLKPVDGDFAWLHDTAAPARLLRIRVSGRGRRHHGRAEKDWSANLNFADYYRF